MPQEQRIDLAAIREMSPAYADLSDQQILDSVYDRHYADRMTRAQFDNRTGGRRAFNIDNVGGHDHRVTTESPEQAMELSQLWAMIMEPGAPVQRYDIDGEMVEATSEEAARLWIESRVMVTDPGIFEMSSGDARYARALEDARSEFDPDDYGAAAEWTNGLMLQGLGPVAAGIDSIGALFDGSDEYGMGEAFNANRQAFNEARDQFRADQPLASMVSGLGGSLATPGAASLGQWTGAGGGLLSTMGRGAVAGVPLGAAAGLLGSDPGEEVQDTVRGGVQGGLVGVGLPLAARAGVAAVRGPLRGVRSGINAATGGRVFGGNADRSAGQQLAESLRSEGVGEAQIRASMNEWLRNGVTPTLLDLVPRGGATQRLIRGSAMQAGGASSAAERYAARVSADLQDNAIGLTRQLTPGEQRPASQVVDSLTERRGQMADIDYAGPYAERLSPSPEVASALGDAPGRVAIRRARDAAIARRDTDQTADLTRMIEALDAGQPLPEVSAGTLHRVRIALGNNARAAMQDPRTRDTGSGLTARAADVADELEAVPGLSDANAAFRQSSQQIDAVERGQEGLRAMPDEFAFDPAVLPQAGVGYRQALTDRIGAPTEAATGILNTIGTSTNQGRNLAAVFGPEVAERYRGGIQNLTQQMQNARMIASSSGSQTAGRLEDSALVTGGAIPQSLTGGLLMAISKIRRGMTLSPQEREAIVGLSTRTADPSALLYRNRSLPVSGQLAPLGSRQAGGAQ